MNRRTFVQATALGAAGAGMLMSRPLWAAEGDATPDDINIAMVGVGRQGRVLLEKLCKIPGIKIKAICDIWSFSQRYGVGRSKQYGHQPELFTDYREMLAKAKDIDAVVIATPDFWHAEMTNACLAAGKHVYCEKEMSNDLEQAAGMVRAQRKHGKLLQIGHQRRSNPYYQHAYRLIHKDGFCGQITQARAQWNQLKPLYPLPAKLLSKYAIDEATLKKFGYESMNHFYFWRWFKDTSGGPMCDLGSHQVDIFCWFLDTPPSIIRAFGNNAWAKEDANERKAGFEPESHDHTLATFHFDTPQGPVNAHYQVSLSTSHGGYYETFMGDHGSMIISEDRSLAAMYKERSAPALAWEDDAAKIEKGGREAMAFDPLKSRKAKGKMDKAALAVEADLKKDVHQLHLENFCDAIRGKTKLTCPPEIGYETAVCCLKANESALTGKEIKLSPDDFKVT